MKHYSFNGGGSVTIAEIFFLACKGKVYISVLYHSVTKDTNTRAAIELCKAKFICVRFLHSSERFFDQAVGIQTGRIKNAAFTASSQWDKFHAPFRARLHIQKQGRYIGAWASRPNNQNQWLMVDLGIPTEVTGIATQGRQDAAQWVTAFWVYYSLDGMHFSRVTYWWDYIRVSVLDLFKH